MISMLRQVEGMPVFGIRYAKDEINYLRVSSLRFLDRSWRIRMYGFYSCTCYMLRLWKDARTIGEGIANWGSEFPQYLTQRLFKFIVDQDMLIYTEICMR